MIAGAGRGRRERFGISERCVRAEGLESAGLVGRDQHLQDPRTAKKKFGRQAIHLAPSSDSPLPGTIMCTCG
jgi:hypothetical protein